MKFNPNLAILILALVIAFGMFALGALLNGERINRKNDRQRIKQVEARQDEINAKINNIYNTAVKRELEILDKVDSTYIILDELYTKKAITQKNYNKQKANIKKQKEAIKDLKRKLGREFIFNTKNK